MLNDFQNVFITSVRFEEVVLNLLMAFFCGLIVSVIYRWSYNGTNYSPSFVHSTVLLAMITALVIMVIGNNLARAFGLVGAMSIIRFRTAVKDTQDIVFIFFSLTVGMAAGVGLRLAAFFGTLFIGGIMLLMSRLQYAAPQKKDFLLQFQSSLPEEDPSYLPVLRKYCKKHNLVNMQAIGVDEMYDLSYFVFLKNKNNSTDFIKELNQVPGINNIRFFFDEEQF
ncbi:MAG: DUF4956 domain-containing protein [Calditrichaeota bacterium]|nr:DUF4956 domain-containing protein [Calditrichota bacterium]MCB0270624.1 DUF4956 domain-containing protein [Calditrichota bacterium]MCB0300122.1 DUF4956 domain-containing protein [Calditrichota bacterium]MCB9067669.1 DUF4956 domain-containing protein [Calditrichia bacterium]